MDYREGLSAALPAPRDDEPGGLRDDILDELTDHLACAFRRELLRGADAATARQRVLERFGDPAALARRLWFDAMKGKIMSQRILVVCCIVLTVISLSLAFVTWNQAVHAQRLAALEAFHAQRAAEEAKAELQAQMQRAQADQQQMRAQLQAISKAAASPRSPDWIPVSFKLTQETPEGPPAAGFHANLGRGNRGAYKEGAIRRESDDKGMIDFGVVQPGDWEFILNNDTWRMTGTLNVLPGTTITKTVVCPTISEQQVPISVHIDWPADLAERGLAIVSSFQHEGFTFQPPLHWYRAGGPSGPGIFAVFCGPGSKQIAEIEPGGIIYWQLQQILGNNAGISAPDVRPFERGHVYLDLPGVDLAGDPKPVQSLTGTYRFRSIAVVRPRQDLARGSHGQRSELMAITSPVRGFREGVFESGDLPKDIESLPQGGPPNMVSTIEGISTADSFWRGADATFEAKKGQPNLWTVRLPDELTQAVREKLKAVTKK